jgi:hypothetical protein
MIKLHDPTTGEVVLERCIENLVTLSGRALLAELLTGAVSGFAKMELAVGGPPASDPDKVPPPPAPTDTALDNELRAVTVTIGPTTQKTDANGNPRMVTPIAGTLEAVLGGDKLVMTEAGIKITKFDDSQHLYNRVTFGSMTKEPNLEMTLTWEVIF